MAQTLLDVAHLQGLGQKLPGPRPQGNFGGVAVAVPRNDDHIGHAGQMGKVALPFKAAAVGQPDSRAILFCAVQNRFRQERTLALNLLDDGHSSNLA